MTPPSMSKTPGVTVASVRSTTVPDASISAVSEDADSAAANAGLSRHARTTAGATIVRPPLSLPINTLAS